MRRSFLRSGLALLAALALPTLASAQGQPPAASSYPDRAIRLVVGFAPGGSNDILARLLAEKLSKSFGQPVIVENKPGAGGAVAASFVKTQPPDGYTLLVGASGAMVVGPAVSAQTPYDTVNDFEPISMLGTFPVVLLVNAEGPHKTVAELVEWSKANPSVANYASVSPTFTLAFELLKLRTGAQLQRVMYRGTSEALTAILSNQVAAAITDPLPAIPLIKSGKLRALAVTTPSRIPELPEVPTMAEAGVSGAEAIFWTGLFGPKDTSKEIIARLEAEIATVMKDPEVRQRLRALATDAAGSSPNEFATRIKSDLQAWSAVAKAANVQIDQ